MTWLYVILSVGLGVLIGGLAMVRHAASAMPASARAEIDEGSYE